MFLGGPLTFFKELKNRFIKTLNLKKENAIFPENSEFFVALGASLFSTKKFEKNTKKCGTEGPKLRYINEGENKKHFPGAKLNQ